MSTPPPAESKDTLARMAQERRDKAHALRELGLDPYRNDLKPSHSCADVRSRYQGTKPAEHVPGMKPVDGEVIRLAGRAVARRGMGKTTFIGLRDSTGELQLYINVNKTDERDFCDALPKLDVGDIVWAEGTVFWTKSGEMSLLTQRFSIVTKSLAPLPDKHHGLTDVEARYRQRYLDLVVNPDVRDVFTKRVAIVRGIRRFLDERDFLEVETPMMHPLVGGAAARPFETHHNALDMDLKLRIAPELYLKRLLVGGFDRVYEINRNFRNEGLSRQHNPEFTMLEFYWAYANYRDLMDLTEELVVGLAKDINDSTSIEWDGQQIELERPWRRLSVRDAVLSQPNMPQDLFEDLSVAGRAAASAGVSPSEIARVLIEGLAEEALQGVAPGGLAELVSGLGDASKVADLTARIAECHGDVETVRVRAGHLGYLIFDEVVESSLIQPTFLTDFPLAVSPLARRKSDDPAFCDRFELFVGGKEIANAFSELNDPDDQRERFKAQLAARDVGADETMDYDEDYCRALEVGMPPAAGEGIGIDRLVMMLTGQASIRDVILFPLMRPE